MNLSSTISAKRRELDIEAGRRQQIVDDIEKLMEKKTTLESDIEVQEKVFSIFQSIEKSWHQSFEEKLSSLVSRSLTFVFVEPLEFLLVSKETGNIAAMDFQIVQRIGDKELTSGIKGAKGGGVVVVVSFLLRVLLIMASKDKIRPILLLDESFAMVSDEFVPNLAQLIKHLVDETGIQIVLVTHQKQFADYADKKYEVTMHSGFDSKYVEIDEEIKE